MFVNINPEPASTEETMCSLKFAAQVNAVQLGDGKGAQRRITTKMSSKAADASKSEKSSKSDKSEKKSSKDKLKDGERKRKADSSLSSKSKK